jgi:CRP/FNR family cyclic AMP-dependent transcriptional regulator
VADRPPGDDPRELFPWLPAHRPEPGKEQLRAEALLRNIPLFHKVPPHRLADIAFVARHETFRAGETIVRMGEPGSTLYVVHAGRVDVVRERPDGRALVLASLGPGEFFGELALFDYGPRAATIVAVEDAETLSLNRGAILRVLEAYPEVAVALLNALCTRLRTADNLLENLAAGPETPTADA